MKNKLESVSAQGRAIIFLRAVFFYLACSIVFFAPVLKYISGYLIGPGEDNMQTLWNIWWWNHHVLLGQGSIFSSAFLFFPDGASLLFHTISPYNLVLSSVIGRFAGLVLTYNILIILTFICSGVSGFYLIRYLVKDNTAALIGGFIFAFNPFHFAQAQHHLNIASIQFLPLFILFLLKALRGRKISDISLAVVFMLLNALCSWHYFIYSMYFMLALYAYRAVKSSTVLLPRFVTVYSVILGSSLIVLSPFIVPMVIKGAGYPVYNDWYYYRNMAADLLGFIIPPRQHLLGDVALFRFISSRFTGNDWIKVVYMGLVNLSIVIVMSKWLMRQAKPYFFGMIFFMVMAMGEFIHFLGYVIPIPLPGFFIKYMPLLSSVRCPARLMVFVYLFLGILVAFVVVRLKADRHFSRIRRVVFWAIAALIFIDYYSYSSDLTQVKLPPGYEVIHNDRDKDFGILDLPGYPDKGWWLNCDRYMMYQTLHGRPIVQGAVSRRVDKALIDFLELDNLGIQKKQLRLNKVKYIIIHKSQDEACRRIRIANYRNTYHVVTENNNVIILQVY